mmetsp:Transcript_2579/g.7031  ORF Transcript_2579/g.7031 Transcript_2579/m.7031 type:complete len:266 (+) Transcript_2579:2844-3641(+)
MEQHPVGIRAVVHDAIQRCRNERNIDVASTVIVVIIDVVGCNDESVSLNASFSRTSERPKHASIVVARRSWRKCSLGETEAPRQQSKAAAAAAVIAISRDDHGRNHPRPPKKFTRQLVAFGAGEGHRRAPQERRLHHGRGHQRRVRRPPLPRQERRLDAGHLDHRHTRSVPQESVGLVQPVLAAVLGDAQQPQAERGPHRADHAAGGILQHRHDHAERRRAAPAVGSSHRGPRPSRALQVHPRGGFRHGFGFRRRQRPPGSFGAP